MFGVLLPWCGLAVFPRLPKRTISDPGTSRFNQGSSLWAGKLGSQGCGEVIAGLPGSLLVTKGSSHPLPLLVAVVVSINI